MGNRCSIQQGEENNCWLEQSPEKSTVSTVPLFLGHPVLWNERDTNSVMIVHVYDIYPDLHVYTSSFYCVFILLYIFDDIHKTINLMTSCCLRHQGPSSRPIVCLNGSNQLIISHVHDYLRCIYRILNNILTGFIQCLLKSCIAVLCCICNAVLIFMKNS